jgi:hypothetical protein
MGRDQAHADPMIGWGLVPTTSPISSGIARLASGATGNRARAAVEECAYGVGRAQCLDGRLEGRGDRRCERLGSAEHRERLRPDELEQQVWRPGGAAAKWTVTRPWSRRSCIATAAVATGAIPSAPAAARMLSPQSLSANGVRVITAGTVIDFASTAAVRHPQ